MVASPFPRVLATNKRASAIDADTSMYRNKTSSQVYQEKRKLHAGLIETRYIRVCVAFSDLSFVHFSRISVGRIKNKPLEQVIRPLSYRYPSYK